MIFSHEHKFIFLKTRKTAGTSVELALRQLCGPDDIIAAIGDAEERRQQVLHYQGRPPQNWRVHGWWQSPRPLFKRYWFRFSPGDYGFYNHIPAKQARTLLNDDKVWRSYFKFAFERNPWDRQVSVYHFRYRDTAAAAPFSSYMRRRRRAWINIRNLFDRQHAVRRLHRPVETLDADLRKGAATGGSQLRSGAAPRKDEFPRDREALPGLLRR
ncbi:MAG TPA: sulfotransferase family 2 domain-containing protein [Methyloceanibacter sp.]|nr:sulfotransferase family 2 domain-containing protein [Methyloceanibacter sp.]